MLALGTVEVTPSSVYVRDAIPEPLGPSAAAMPISAAPVSHAPSAAPEACAVGAVASTLTTKVLAGSAFCAASTDR